ncbi:MAG: ribbon-helix-helix domain-containing protein [Candidatus Diapherotrites archaeon]
MENVSLKLEGGIAKQISEVMREFNYSTKTEFIRDAIRSKLKELEEKRRTDEAWDKLLSLKGAFKGKMRFKTYEEWHNWRSNEGSKELREHFEKKFGLNKK